MREMFDGVLNGKTPTYPTIYDIVELRHTEVGPKYINKIINICT
jgi:hypothetical protein